MASARAQTDNGTRGGAEGRDAARAANNMDVLGCVTDCGVWDVLACTELGEEEGSSDLTSRRRWEQQREAEYLGGAFGYRARRGVYAATRRPSGQVLEALK